MSKMARPGFAAIRSPRARMVALGLAGVLVLTLGTAVLAEQAPAIGGQTSGQATSRLPEIQAVETAIRKSDFADARQKTLALIDRDFAKRDPKAAAYAAYLLAQADMYAGHWQDLYDTLIGRADSVIRDLDQRRADEFALLLADAAGRTGRPDEQDKLLDLHVEAIARRSGPGSEQTLNARVDAAYSQLTAKRADIAEKRLFSALNAMELNGDADQLFKTVGQAGDHFNRFAGFEAAQRVFQRGLDARPSDEPKEGDGDNIVYARELLSWNLRSSQLVVVSACDTALGDIGVTSTVRGLPLALSVAGARRTLWTVERVDDAATMQLMARFYGNLFDAGISYADAFIKTKREAWAGKIGGFPAALTSAYILFEH